MSFGTFRGAETVGYEPKKTDVALTTNDRAAWEENATNLQSPVGLLHSHSSKNYVSTPDEVLK